MRPGVPAVGAGPRIYAMSALAPEQSFVNQLLVAMPGMADDTFAGSVVYLCEHSEKGALGLVINRPIDINVGRLFEKVELPLRRDDLAEEPVCFGGPVQTERGFVLHDTVPGQFSSTLHVPGGVDMTTSKDVLEALAEGGGPRRVFIALGYTGWSAGQLEDEISRNGWLTIQASPEHIAEIIFEAPFDDRYQRALSLLGIAPGALMQGAGHA